MAVEYFLDKHSEDDYDDYCLSYLFTYRDFSGGVLGLAWVGDVNTGGGGVCEKHNVRFTAIDFAGNTVNEELSLADEAQHTDYRGFDGRLFYLI